VLEPGAEVDRYVVVKPLGEGGMAKVWLVEHAGLHTRHALKVLQLTGPSLRMRFLEEGKAQGRLQHENIVRVSDQVEVDGLPALVLDYVDGPDLSHWIARERPDPARAEALFKGILAGVQAAHAAGMIHRDLKPGNVLVATGPDGAPIPKVADFGLAKALSGPDAERGFRTRQGLPMGTPRYMAPEQARDASRADVRSDVFSLGAILHELLAHEPAYEGADVMEIYQAVQEGRRRPLPPAVPARLARVVDACLSVDPARRPPDVSAILRMLEPAPVPALASPSAAPSLRTAAWTLAAVSVLGAGALIALVTLAWALWSGGGAADPTAACPVTEGPLGALRAPTVFGKKTGDSWLLRDRTAVYAAVPAAGEEPAVRCMLPVGTRVTLVADPVVVGRERWIAIDGAQLTAPVANDPELGENRGPCVGEPGAFVGYFQTRGGGLFGGGAPREGRTWSVPAGREIFSFVPAADADDPPVVCVVAEDVRIDVVGEPVKVGKDWWVPFTLPSASRR
jgi:hypothetical protein